MHSYLITTPNFYGSTPEIFTTKLREQLKKHKPDFMLLRDKESGNYDSLAKAFLELAKEFPKTKAFLHREINLAKELGAKGVHLSSDMLDKVGEAKAAGLEVVVSTHTLEDVLFAQEQGASYVTYSPIFSSPGKGEPIGVKALEDLIKEVDIKVFALGGIVKEEQIEAVEAVGAFGFASIRYFY